MRAGDALDGNTLDGALGTLDLDTLEPTGATFKWNILQDCSNCVYTGPPCLITRLVLGFRVLSDNHCIHSDRVKAGDFLTGLDDGTFFDFFGEGLGDNILLLDLDEFVLEDPFGTNLLVYIFGLLSLCSAQYRSTASLHFKWLDLRLCESVYSVSHRTQYCL
jgi:hypothetical protein